MMKKNEDQLAIFELIQLFTDELSKAFAKEKSLRIKKEKLEAELKKINDRIDEKSAVKDVFEDKQFSELTEATKEGLLAKVAKDLSSSGKKTASSRKKPTGASRGKRGRSERLNALRRAIGGEAEIMLSDLKEKLGVSNVSQWLKSLDVPSGAVVRLGAKRDGSKLVVSKLKDEFWKPI